MKSKKYRFNKKPKTRKRLGGTITSVLDLKGKNIFAKTSGKKIFNTKIGKWENQNCYNLLGFNYCTRTKST